VYAAFPRHIRMVLLRVKSRNKGGDGIGLVWIPIGWVKVSTNDLSPPSVTNGKLCASQGCCDKQLAPDAFAIACTLSRSVFKFGCLLMQRNGVDAKSPSTFSSSPPLSSQKVHGFSGAEEVQRSHAAGALERGLMVYPLK